MGLNSLKIYESINERQKAYHERKRRKNILQNPFFVEGQQRPTIMGILVYAVAHGVLPSDEGRGDICDLRGLATTATFDHPCPKCRFHLSGHYPLGQDPFGASTVWPPSACISIKAKGTVSSWPLRIPSGIIIFLVILISPPTTPCKRYVATTSRPCHN